jgi:hypothetical protein
MQAEIYRPGEFAGGDVVDLMNMDAVVTEAVGVVLALKRALEVPGTGHVKRAALMEAELFLSQFTWSDDEHPAG